jgi:hypothetical protein
MNLNVDKRQINESVLNTILKSANSLYHILSSQQIFAKVDKIFATIKIKLQFIE